MVGNFVKIANYPMLIFLPSAKSNQQNLGTIKSSNLCTEIIEYSAPDEVAVCNLASLALPAFISNGTYDFKRLHAVTKVVTKNLNKVIGEQSCRASPALLTDLVFRRCQLLSRSGSQELQYATPTRRSRCAGSR